MIEWLEMAGALILGAAAGGFFLASLWWTVRRLPESRKPWLLWMGSLLVRMGVVLAALTPLAMRGDWRLLVAAGVGFALIRTVGVRIVAQNVERDARTSH